MDSTAIVVVDYDPEWPLVFDEIKALFDEALGPCPAVVEHVGGTAVPGLAAKPVLDIDVMVPDARHASQAIARLAPLGYRHIGDLGLTGRQALTRESPQTPHDGSGRTWMEQHVYVGTRECIPFRRHLALRDYLRGRADAAAQYASLKRELATRYALDREAYVAGKTAFVMRIYAKVLA